MQNITRDIKIKYKLTVTRGQWGGDKGMREGKGCQGTCIKDTWTKPKEVGSKRGGGDVWSGGQWWGKNGDNCT